jgi:chromate transporter
MTTVTKGVAPLRAGDALPIASRTLFLVFSQMALMGFGGVLPFAYRMLVEKRGWLTDHDFSQYLAFSQMLPGPTICNMAVLVGWRFNRLSGATAAFAGMLVGPTLVVIVLGLVYTSVATHPVVRQALAGMSAVAAGLILATAVKMAIGLLKSERRLVGVALAAAFAVLAFVGVGLLRWPLILVALGLAPLAIASAWLQLRGPDAD